MNSMIASQLAVYCEVCGEQGTREVFTDRIMSYPGEGPKHAWFCKECKMATREFRETKVDREIRMMPVWVKLTDDGKEVRMTDVLTSKGKV